MDSMLDVRNNVLYNSIRKVGETMSNTVNITNARNNLYQLVNEVNTNHEPITLVSKKGFNAVLMSESDYNALQETIYLLGNPIMSKIIIDGMNEPLDECEEYVEGEEW